MRRIFSSSVAVPSQQAGGAAASVPTTQHGVPFTATSSTCHQRRSSHRTRRYCSCNGMLSLRLLLMVGSLCLCVLLLMTSRMHVPSSSSSPVSLDHHSPPVAAAGVAEKTAMRRRSSWEETPRMRFRPSVAVQEAIQRIDEQENERDDDEEDERTTAGLAELYCKHTNPPPGMVRPQCQLHQSPKGPMLLVVTASEGQFYASPDSGTDSDGNSNKTLPMQKVPSLRSLRWLRHVRCPVVVVIKSNYTTSFRRNGQRWEENVNGRNKRREETMKSPLLVAPASSFSSSSAKKGQVFESILQVVWRNVEALVKRSSAEDASLFANWTSERSLEVLHAKSATWMLRKALRGDGPLFIFESPNVGDEALTIAEVSAKLSSIFGPHRDRPCNPTRDPLCLYYSHTRTVNAPYHVPPPEWVVFVHGHQESWHGVDIVAQLQCLCLSSSQERYRTLTTPARAFYLQCMPMRMNLTETVQAMGTFFNADQEAYYVSIAKRSAALSDQFRRAFQYLVTDSEESAWRRLSSSSFTSTTPQRHLASDLLGDVWGTNPAAAVAELRARRRSTEKAQKEANDDEDPVLWNHVNWSAGEQDETWTQWLDAVFEETELPPQEQSFRRFNGDERSGASRSRRIMTPPAIVRDCCATFVVSLQAIVERPPSFYEALSLKLHAQPALVFLTVDDPRQQHEPKREDAAVGTPPLKQPILPLSVVTTLSNGTWLYRDGEASMYLERFWRYLFQPSVYDNQRDFLHEHCDGSGGLFDMHRTPVDGRKVASAQQPEQGEVILFECPSAFRLVQRRKDDDDHNRGKLRTELSPSSFSSARTKREGDEVEDDALLDVWHKAVRNDSWRCPASYLRTNIFR